MYIASGATRVDVILSHFAVVNENQIEKIKNSKISKIIDHF